MVYVQWCTLRWWFDDAPIHYDNTLIMMHIHGDLFNNDIACYDDVDNVCTVKWTVMKKHVQWSKYSIH